MMHSFKMFKSLASVVMASACLASLSLTASAAPASIAGKWKGGGFVELSSGDRERVQCQATFRRAGGQKFSVNARCVSGAGQIDQSGELSRITRNRYVGMVRNEEFGINGSVRITVRGGRQYVTISSSQGSAKLNLRRR